jgi:hypothetical protein
MARTYIFDPEGMFFYILKYRIPGLGAINRKKNPRESFGESFGESLYAIKG